jgi:hypothetical protein
MKKFVLILALICTGVTSSTLVAQVTIGNNTEPNSNAVLDLISNGNKGLLLPRVALIATNDPAPTTAHTAGMTVYNTATSSASVAFEYYVSPGLYYNDGTKWVRLPLGYTNWFYMPSVSFDTSTNGTGRTKNLYSLYYNQYKTPLVKSAGAPVSVPYIPAATDLYYYITDYDTSVFANVSINASGVMTYDVISSATSCSYINIVFVLK